MIGTNDEVLDRIASECGGVVSFAARCFEGGGTVLYHPDRRCPTASVIKFPILVHTVLLAHEGHVSMDDVLTLRAEEIVPGSGILQKLTPGLQISLRDACTMMIALSDNTATNMVLEHVGIEAVNQRNLSLGLQNTRVFRKVYCDDVPGDALNRQFGFGMTTPRDMLRLLTDVRAGMVGGPEPSALIREFLATQQSIDGIPRFLPEDCVFEGKGGAVDHVRNDVGFVRCPDGVEMAFAIFCQKLPRVQWTPDNPGLLTIGHLTRELYDRFTSDGEYSLDE